MQMQKTSLDASKKNFLEIKRIDKNEAARILTPYHYLSNISKGFKSGFNYGLFFDNEIIGVAIFTGLPVPELVKGMLGLHLGVVSLYMKKII